MDTPARCRVLVVEDHPEGRYLLRLVLELSGFEVQEAPDGLQGVEKALSWRPDVAVVDIELPYLSGYEVAREIKAALGGRIRLIALTAYGQPADKQRAAEAGFDLHITKPAAPEELVGYLRARTPASSENASVSCGTVLPLTDGQPLPGSQLRSLSSLPARP